MTSALSAVGAFAQHASTSEVLADWLERVIDGPPPDDLVVPASEPSALSYLLAVVARHATTEQARRLAGAGAVLFRRWVLAFNARMEDGPSRRRLRGVLRIFQSVAPPWWVADEVARLLRTWAPEGHDEEDAETRRQLLWALCLGVGSEDQRTEATRLLVSHLGDPDYVVTALDGLRRISLREAVENVPAALRTMQLGQVAPHRALWALFRWLEREPELAGRLRRVTDDAGVTETVMRVVGAELKGDVDFANAWASFVAEPAEATEPARPTGVERMNLAGPPTKQAA
jgi:hypothetical protein